LKDDDDDDDDMMWLSTSKIIRDEIYGNSRVNAKDTDALVEGK